MASLSGAGVSPPDLGLQFAYLVHARVIARGSSGNKSLPSGFYAIMAAMKTTTSAERIAEACRGIVRRSDQIVALAETPGAGLSRIFSRKEIGVTNG